MKKLSVAGLIIFAVAGSETATAQTCEGLFRSSEGVLASAPIRTELLRLQALIRESANEDGLLHVVNLVAGPKIERAFVTFLFEQVAPSERPRAMREFATRLLLNHRPLVVDRVREMVTAYRRGELFTSQNPETFLRSSISAEKLVEFTHIGATFEYRPAFKSALETAIGDYKQFHSAEGSRIQNAAAISSLMMAFKLHQNPSVIGEFVTRFEDAHPFVRVYMLDAVTALVPLNARELTFRLRDRSSDDAILNLNLMPKAKLEEQAFFESTSKGEGNRPKLLVSPVIVEAGLRYLQRHDYDFTAESVSFATSYLVDLSIRDRRIDDAVLKVLRRSEKGDARTGLEMFFRAELASLELEMVSRRLSGFTNVESPTARIQAELKETTTDNLLFLRHVIEFNWKYGLDRVAPLADLASAYFARNPQQLDQLSRLTPRATEYYRREQLGRHSRR